MVYLKDRIIQNNGNSKILFICRSIRHIVRKPSKKLFIFLNLGKITYMCDYIHDKYLEVYIRKCDGSYFGGIK